MEIEKKIYKKNTKYLIDIYYKAFSDEEVTEFIDQN